MFLFRDHISRGNILPLDFGGGKSELSKKEAVPRLQAGIEASRLKSGRGRDQRGLRTFTGAEPVEKWSLPVFSLSQDELTLECYIASLKLTGFVEPTTVSKMDHKGAEGEVKVHSLSSKW